MRIRNAVLVCALMLGLGNAQAELFDRGGGLIYDDVLNVTWLGDANYAKASGYDSDGKMNWYEANTWAENLSFHDGVRNVDYTDWRLPTVRPINGSTFTFAPSYNGTSDHSYNISSIGTAYAGSTSNEMAHLYYNSLGNKSPCNPTSGVNCVDQAGYGLVNTGFFANLQSDNYWSGTETGVDSGRAWHFAFHNGGQDQNPADTNYMYAWAVRDGDVTAPIPEPETYAMMLAGLGLLGVMTRRRKQKAVA